MTFGRAYVIVTLVLGVLAGPLAADAQPPGKVYRVGVVIGGLPLQRSLVEGLGALGYVEGKNITFEYKFWDGRPEHFPQLVAELIDQRVDVIVSSSTPAVRAAKKATSTIPIVMAGLTDPVGAGLIDSLARPGGNITGLTNIFTELSAKRLDLLKEAVPRLSRVAVVWNPTHPGQTLAFKDTEGAGKVLGVTVLSMEVRRPEDFDRAFTAIVTKRADGLQVLPDPLTSLHRRQIAHFALKKRLPAMYAAREWAEAGGLMAYGPSFPDLWRQAAVYVDKILKGAKPANLPVEQPTKFELVINLKTAKTLGLTLPQSILIRADEVIPP